MCFGVVADPVAALHDLGGEVWECAHVATHHEERGASLVAIEEIEQGRGCRGIRAVIEGQRDRAGIARVAHRGPKYLR